MFKKFFFHIIYQRKKESFTAYVFRICAPANIMAAAFMFLYAAFFLKMTAEDFTKNALYFALAGITVQFVIAPFTNALVTKRISRDLMFLKNMKLSDIEKENLLSEILEYPKSKTIEVFFVFLIYGIAFNIILYLQRKINFSTALILYLCCTFVAYLSAILASYFIATICCQKAVNLIEKDQDKKYSVGKNVFRYSLTTLFLLYIIFPIFACLCLTFIFLLYNKALITTTEELLKILFNLSVLSFAELITITLFAFLFFGRIHNYNNSMQKGLLSIDKTNLKASSLIPVDLFTEISYSMYLINRTIVLFKNLMENTAKINERLNGNAQSLSAIVKESESTSVSQLAGIEEILATMRSSLEQTTLIERKIGEVNNVAAKTKENVIEGFESVKKTGLKMQEVIQANQSTILGIQSLNNKINSIWDIVNLIDSVADQTKIIAFNAELETENMQEEKERFENVASEIRSLASGVMSLTEEIRSQIQEIQQSSNELILSGKAGSKKFSEGNELILALEENFEKIDNSAKLTATSSEVIQKVIVEQKLAFDGIVEQLEQINASLENFKSAANNISDTVQELGKNSSHLTSLYISKEEEK